MVVVGFVTGVDGVNERNFVCFHLFEIHLDRFLFFFLPRATGIMCVCVYLFVGFDEICLVTQRKKTSTPRKKKKKNQTKPKQNKTKTKPHTHCVQLLVMMDVQDGSDSIGRVWIMMDQTGC